MCIVFFYLLNMQFYCCAESFFYHFCVNMLFKYWAAGIDIDLHPPHNSHQMFTIKYLSASLV